jgi:hypothetical protein
METVPKGAIALTVDAVSREINAVKMKNVHRE